MRTLMVLLIAAGFTTAEARQPIRTGSPSNGANWSAMRAVGEPDATPNADHVNAWASLLADRGPEWLQLDFARPVSVAKLRIHQSFNPGAVVRVEAYPAKGAPVVVWAGGDDARPTVLELALTGDVRASRVRIHLDTLRVPGWNEIDAVALVGADGSVQWASSATASSSYAAQGGAGPFAGHVGKPVRVTHQKGVIVGTLVGVHERVLELTHAKTGRTVLVGLDALVTLEAL